MMVNAYPNDIDDARSRRLLHLYRLYLICAPSFILIEGASNLHPKLLDPQDSRIPDSDSSRPKRCARCGTPAVLKNVKDITISKVFTILNLLTFDRAKDT